MKKSILFVLLFLATLSMSFSKPKLYVTIHKDACFTCNGAKVLTALNRHPMAASCDRALVVIGLSPKQLKYYKSDIDSLFPKLTIIYDTSGYYKKALGYKKSMEYIIADSNNKVLSRTSDLQAFVNTPVKIPKGMSLREYKSLDFTDDFTLVSSTVAIKNDKFVAYDTPQRKFFILNTNSMAKSAFSIDDLLPHISTQITEAELIKKFAKKYNLIDFEQFIQTNDYDITMCLKVVDRIATMDNYSIPKFKYYLAKQIENKIEIISDFIMPSGFDIHGSKAMALKDGKYYVAVYDHRYHHTKHDKVKDTTALLIEVNGRDSSYRIVMNYTKADSLCGRKFGLLFMPSITLLNNQIYMHSAENGIFAKQTESGFENILQPETKLQTLIDAHKILDMDKFLSGVPYERPTLYDCFGLDRYRDNYIVTLVEYAEQTGNDIKSSIYQFYDSNGNFQNELTVPVESESECKLLKNSGNTLRLFKWNDEKLIIYDVIED